MNHYPYILKSAIILLFFSVLAASTVSGSPVQASGRLKDKTLSPGIYDGTFIFTIEHTYNKPVEGVMPTNYYSLLAKEARGSIRFRANEYGVVKGVSIRFPQFRYDVVQSQFLTVPKGSQGEYHCTGNNAYAVGKGTASGGSGQSGAPPLSPTPSDFWTKPVKLNAGAVSGRVRLIGKCPGKADNKKFIEGIKWDINSLPATPWTFKITWLGVDGSSASGTCSTDSWVTAEHSISCSWTAWRVEK